MKKVLTAIFLALCSLAIPDFLAIAEDVEKFNLEELLNPVYSSKEEIKKARETYKSTCADLDYFLELERIIAKGKAPSAVDDLDVLDLGVLRAVKQLIELFLVFTETDEKFYKGLDYEWVNLETTRYSTIVKLREKVKIPPPEGFVYIRYFPDKESLPSAIQPVFRREGAKGATIFGRYIAILKEKGIEPAKEELQKRVLPKTLYHELVHAYINSVLGLKRDRLPIWFHEGCAIYFSKSGGMESTIIKEPKIDGLTYITVVNFSPEDYGNYELVFNFLEDKLGKKRFYELIKKVVEEARVDPLLEEMKTNSFEGLSTRAKIWRMKKDRVWWIALGLFLFLFFWVGLKSYEASSPLGAKRENPKV